MLKLNPYLNFLGRTEEAFIFYKSVFGGEFIMLQRFADVKDLPNKEKMTDEDMQKIMHVALPIGGNILMGTDALTSLGHQLVTGNNISLAIGTDSKEEADRLYSAFLEGGTTDMPMADMFWGSYFGMVDDKFGIKWMISFDPQNQ